MKILINCLYWFSLLFYIEVSWTLRALLVFYFPCLHSASFLSLKVNEYGSLAPRRFFPLQRDLHRQTFFLSHFSFFPFFIVYLAFLSTLLWFIRFMCMVMSECVKTNLYTRWNWFFFSFCLSVSPFPPRSQSLAVHFQGHCITQPDATQRERKSRSNMKNMINIYVVSIAFFLAR